MQTKSKGSLEGEICHSPVRRKVREPVELAELSKKKAPWP